MPDDEKVESGLTHAIDTLSKTLADQQAAIDRLSSELGSVAQALAAAQVELGRALEVNATQLAVIDSQQATIAALQAELAGNTPAPRPVASVSILIGGQHPMGVVNISVDDTTGKATAQFEDDHGDVVAAPAGAVLTWTSDNASAVTVAADPTDPTGATAHLSVAAGATAGMSANIGLGIADASGNPITAPDGTALAATPVQVDLVAGPAAQVVLSVAP